MKSRKFCSLTSVHRKVVIVSWLPSLVYLFSFVLLLFVIVCPFIYRYLIWLEIFLLLGLISLMTFYFHSLAWPSISALDMKASFHDSFPNSYALTTFLFSRQLSVYLFWLPVKQLNLFPFVKCFIRYEFPFHLIWVTSHDVSCPGTLSCSATTVSAAFETLKTVSYYRFFHDFRGTVKIRV